MCGWEKPLPDLSSFIRGLPALSMLRGLSRQEDEPQDRRLYAGSEGERGAAPAGRRGAWELGILPRDETSFPFLGRQGCRPTVSRVEMYKNSTVGGGVLPLDPSRGRILFPGPFLGSIHLAAAAQRARPPGEVCTCGAPP